MVRVAAISDLHGFRDFDLPSCDVLLIAGDICPDRIGRFWTRHDPSLCALYVENQLVNWLSPYVDAGRIGHVVMTWGNHDWTETIGESLNLPPKFHMLVDREVTIAGLRVWGTPWSNEFCGWAWMKHPMVLAPVYEKIPHGVDIILSHQPPHGCCDSIRADWTSSVIASPAESLSSRELRRAVVAIKPQVVVCGHIHSGYGEASLGDTRVYNASVVNEQYDHVNRVTQFRVNARDHESPSKSR